MVQQVISLCNCAVTRLALTTLTSTMTLTTTLVAHCCAQPDGTALLQVELSIKPNSQRPSSHLALMPVTSVNVAAIWSLVSNSS